MMDDDKTIHEEGEEVDSPPTSKDKAEIEKIEEQKLKSKFPGRQLSHFHPYYVMEIFSLHIIYCIKVMPYEIILKRKFFFSYFYTEHL